MSTIIFNPNLKEETLSECKSLANQILGVDEVSFAGLFDRCNEAWVELANVFDVGTSKSESFEDLERRARKGIAELSMGLHVENTIVGEQNAKLKVNATVDSLTGVKNRRAYDEEAPNEWQRTKRLKKSFVLMMVDIDHFKKVNDTYGHAAGDSVLVLVAQQLKSLIRQYDSVYRFGGEEFVILVHECSPAEVAIIAERIRSEIERLDINLSDGSTIKITASFGVVIHSHNDPESMDGLLAVADKLLYQAKKEGRNRVCKNFDVAPMPAVHLQPSIQLQSNPTVDLV